MLKTTLKNNAVFVVIAGICLAAGICQKSSAEPGVENQPVSPVRQLMLSSLVPASSSVFAVANEAPKDAAEWNVVERNAFALADHGKQLLKMLPPNAEAWIKHSTHLIDSSTEAADAAKAKDADKVSDAGNAIYESCEGCHKLYLILPAHK
jgi:cytochrome c556